MDLMDFYRRFIAGKSPSEETMNRFLGGLWEKHYVRLCMIAMVRTRDINTAEDVVGEAWLKLLRFVRKGGELRETFEAFLYEIVRNQVRTWLRKAMRSPERTAEEDDEGMTPLDAAEAPENLAPDPLDGMLREELLKALDACCEELPEQQRAALELRLRGKTYAEIAQALNVSEMYVGVLLHRAQKNLRACLERKAAG
jgi:RNA polymerase sigma factor (sigma-70 family)